MRKVYYKIFCIALSSAEVNLRQKQIAEYWTGVDDEKTLFKLAKTDEVSSHIAWLIRNAGINVLSLWAEEEKSVHNHVSILMSTLEIIAQCLLTNNIKVVALKNAGIAKAIYPNYACSPMGDIDLLVSAADFHKAHELITQNMGFTFKFRSELEEEDLTKAYKGGGSEYYKEVDGHKVWVELQWRPIAGRWIQPHNEPTGDELLQRSIPVKDSAVRILAPEDNLLQVALHTAKHSYVRAPGFRLHSDVDRLVRHQTINWDLFVTNVLKLKVKTAVYFSLYFASELLETPIPGDIMLRLQPVWFRKQLILYFIKKAGIFNQKKKKFSKAGYIIFNLALYDNISENLRALFPSYETIKIKYPIKNRWELPYFYVLRFMDLAFKRAKL